MEYEVLKSRGTVDEWRVEAVSDDGDCYVVLFSGPHAEQRAREYADWKNQQKQLEIVERNIAEELL